MIYHGLFGIEFEENGVRFAPVVPKNFQRLTLSGVKYRQATLKIVIQGNGTQVSRFKLDGKEQQDRFFDAALQGNHEIEIHMMREAQPKAGPKNAD